MNHLARALRGIPRRPLKLLLCTLVAGNIIAWLAAVGLAVNQTGILALASLAWILGIRHAFDVDHIAAIDNVTRKLHHSGQRPVAVGFFFALGHSTIVVVLSVVIVLGVQGLQAPILSLGHVGALFGTGLSASFLTVIGGVNVVVLWHLIKVYRDHHRAGDDDASPNAGAVDALLDQRGVLARALRFLFRRVDRSWHMFPVGLCFGLGFDTATEIAILGIAAELGSGAERLSLLGIMVFPFLFTAGMTLMDSLDGLIMLRAYQWAVSDGRRRLHFNILITGIAVIAALMIAALEWLQLAGLRWGSASVFWNRLEGLDFSVIGIAVVAVMLATWAIAIVYVARATPTLSAGGESEP